MFCCLLNIVGMTGLATAQSATAPLNAFPVPLAAGALITNLCKKIASQPTFVFYAFALQVNLQQGIKNKKMSFDIFLLHLVSRDDWIRTSDNTPPRRVL